MSFRRGAASLIMLTLLSMSRLPPVMAQELYVLGPQDSLEILVFGNPEVSRTVTIRPDGMISLPLIGEVTAAGLTPEQLRQQLTMLFRPFFWDPQVSVIVREVHRMQVSVIGQVARPGVYELAQGAGVLDALAAASGLAADAGLGEARLVRRQDPPMIIDLEGLLLRGDPALNMPLESGDVLVVPEDSTARVYVLGEVTRPGALPYRGPMTALNALTQAGGPTGRAMLDRASIIRRTRPAAQSAATIPPIEGVSKGSPPGIQVIPVDLLKLVRGGAMTGDLQLQRGDVLYVPDNPVALERIGLLLGVAANAMFLLR